LQKQIATLNVASIQMKLNSCNTFEKITSDWRVTTQKVSLKALETIVSN
jgi:hypothetical protein